MASAGSRLLTRPALIGLATGTLYGLVSRFATELPIAGLFGVMTWAFLFVVPVVVGYLTVRPHPNPTWTWRLCAPWIPILISVAVAWAVGWEGAICIVMGLPLLLILSSIGGMLGAGASSRRRAAIMALLPLLVAPLERLLPTRDSAHRVETSISIAAAPAEVWAEIIEVPTILPQEQRPALFTRMGFPRPVSATLTGSGVGAVRQARFEGGVLFAETITDWEVERLLRFRIRAASDSVPVTTLDRHVVVGGRYLDVLSGTYQIEPADSGVRLRLTSELRVSTPFNFYAGPWVDAIMRSIQRNILEVVRQRAEVRTSSPVRESGNQGRN